VAQPSDGAVGLGKESVHAFTEAMAVQAELLLVSVAPTRNTAP
jgi:hypothetical protein